MLHFHHSLESSIFSGEEHRLISQTVVIEPKFDPENFFLCPWNSKDKKKSADPDTNFCDLSLFQSLTRDSGQRQNMVTADHKGTRQRTGPLFHTNLLYYFPIQYNFSTENVNQFIKSTSYRPKINSMRFKNSFLTQ